MRAASHPPVWIHRKCELRSLKKMLNGLCWDDDYTIAQWLEHRWLQARVPGSSPGGDSQFFLQTFPVCLFPSNQSIIIIIIIILVFRTDLARWLRCSNGTSVRSSRHTVPGSGKLSTRRSPRSSCLNNNNFKNSTRRQ